MKKLLALFIVLTLTLLPVTSFAEGQVMALRAEDLVVTSDGETMLDLTGLNLSAAFGAGDEGAMLQLRLGAGEKIAANVLAEFNKDGLYFTADGLNDVYSVKWADLFKLIFGEDAGTILDSAAKLVNAFGKIMTEENMADLTERMNACMNDVLTMITEGMTAEQVSATIEGKEYAGTKTVFSYDGAALKAMLLKVTAAYDANPGFAEFVAALGEIMGQTGLTMTAMYEQIDINTTISGELFTSDDGNATDIRVSFDDGETVFPIEFVQTVDEEYNTAFTLVLGPDDDVVLLRGELGTVIGFYLYAGARDDLDPVGNLTVTFDENGPVIQIAGASSVAKYTFGPDCILRIEAASYAENDFTYQALTKTETIVLAGGMNGSDFDLTLTRTAANAGEEAVTETLATLTGTIGENGISGQLTVYAEGESVIFDFTLEAGETGLVLKFGMNAGEDFTYNYEYTIAVEGDQMNVHCVTASNIFGIESSNDVAFAGTILENGVSGQFTGSESTSYDYGDESGEKYVTSLGYALKLGVSVDEMPELRLVNTTETKDLIEILSAGEDSLQSQAFYSAAGTVLMNMLATIEEQCPALSDIVNGIL